MSENQKKPNSNDGEINDETLDAVSGGQGKQPVQVEGFTVTATRLKPSQSAAVRSVESITVSATKLTDKPSTQVASANTPKKPV